MWIKLSFYLFWWHGIGLISNASDQSEQDLACLDEFHLPNDFVARHDWWRVALFFYLFQWLFVWSIATRRPQNLNHRRKLGTSYQFWCGSKFLLIKLFFISYFWEENSELVDMYSQYHDAYATRIMLNKLQKQNTIACSAFVSGYTL